MCHESHICIACSIVPQLYHYRVHRLELATSDGNQILCSVLVSYHYLVFHGMTQGSVPITIYNNLSPFTFFIWKLSIFVLFICLKTRSWFTSQQIFQQILQQYGPSSALSLKVTDYALLPDQPLLAVQMLNQNMSSHVLLANPPKTKKVRNNKLPFGMQRPKRKRKTKTKEPDSKASLILKSLQHVSRAPPGVKPLQDVGAKPCKEQEQVPSVERSTGFDSADEVMVASDSDSANSVVSNEESSSSSTSSHESEVQELPSHPQQRHEEQVTEEILQKREELQMSQMRENPADATQSELQCMGQGVSSAGARKQSTQCNPFIGVRDVDVQRGARLAKCQFCSEKISKGSIRIAYAFSKIKFHGYVHSHCFPSYLVNMKGDKRQAIDFLQSWQTSHPDFDSSLMTTITTLVSELHQTA